MIYLVGGVFRSGKSSFSYHLLENHKVPYLSTDVIRCVLQKQAPQLGIQGDGSIQQKSEIFYPYLENLVYMQDCLKKDYCIEGEVISPKAVSDIASIYPVRACFFGCKQSSAEILKSRKGINDWISECDDDKISQLAETQMTESAWLESECKKYDLPYIELNSTSSEELESVFQKYLVQ